MSKIQTDRIEDKLGNNGVNVTDLNVLVNTKLVETYIKTAPNDVTSVVALQVSGTSETNTDLVLSAKGSGAIVRQIPDGTAVGGNKRGVFAVDLQVTASQTAVASGNYSVVAGGSFNTASGPYSVTSGGYSNTNYSTYSVISGGAQNTINATFDYSVIAGGRNNQANALYSSCSGGAYAIARGLHGVEFRANGLFSVLGDAQKRSVILRRQTSNTTQVRLNSDGTTVASSNNNFILPNNSAFKFSADILARDATGITSAWNVVGLIKRDANAAATALVGSPTVTLIAQDSTASTWAVSITADTALGALAFSVTGPSTAVKWIANVETLELVG